MANNPTILQVFNESGIEIPIQDKEAEALLSQIAKEEKCGFSFVELVYVNEPEIVRINKEHLDRDYVTDIISFRYDEEESNQHIEGTLFCCAPRIKEQAIELGETVRKEFLRIFIHGVLHLIGYDDATENEKKQMSALEDKYLALIKS